MFRRLTILEPLNQNLPLKSISQETLNNDCEVNNQPTFAVKVSKEAKTRLYVNIAQDCELFKTTPGNS